MEFKIEPLREKDLEELYLLIKQVFSKDLEYVIAKTKWAFNNEHSFVLVAKVDGKIIASRGGFNWPLIKNGLELRAVQFHGTCVHPDYRRLGLFTKLNLAYLEYSAQRDINYIFNVSVATSRIGYEKLGWLYIKDFHRLTRFHKPFKILYQRFKKTAVSQNRIVINDVIAEIPQKFLDARKLQFENVVCTDYTKLFLKWRLDNPEENYRVFKNDNSCVVYKIKQTTLNKEIIFGDFFLLTNSFRTFAKVLNEILIMEKPDVSYTYISKSHPYFNFYLKSLYIPNPFNYHLNFGTRLITGKPLGDKWAMSFLDIDTF